MDGVDAQTFWLDKPTNSFADPLTAYGWAHVLDSVTGGDVQIDDMGPVFKLRAARPLDQAALAAVTGLDLLPWIETAKAPHPPGKWSINYDDKRAEENAYFAGLKAMPKRPPGAAPDDYPEGPQRPHPDLPLFKLVNQMSALTAYNEVVSRWYADRALWADYLRLLARLFSRHPNDLPGAEAAWKQLARAAGLKGAVRVTAAQIVNPAMGKGGDAPKANSLAPGNKDSFWLLEYLKFLGAKEAALPLVVRGTKDRKTYVPLPRRMSLAAHKRIVAEFRARLWASTAIKMDVLAGLTYTHAFLRQWGAGQLTDLYLVSADPRDFVTGLAVGFYKDLGSARALLNLAQINLPTWMRVETADGATRYMALLDEHTRIVRSLSEDHCDEHHLLRRYRDFLSAHDLDAFYDFAAGYAHLLMTRLERRQPAHQFTEANLEVLIMGHSDVEPRLGEIVATPGFRNLATAIRLSTIVPQRQKARKAPRHYDVRYGLGDELKRKLAYPSELVQALGAFVHSYNQETVQLMERNTGRPGRKLVTTDDLDQVLGLIDQHGSKTVGSLLIAYGYARATYTAPGEPEAPQAADEGPFDTLNDTMDIEAGEAE